ncbi:MAG TPA: sulfotransferase domain-containing protein [Casimicrobiaceae bacterium]
MSASLLDPRVDVVIGGVQKGGTTALDLVLRKHPAMRMGSEKEPHWFDIEENFHPQPRDVAEYHALWGDQLATGICCDSTPSYVWWPSAVQRIHTYNPAMRWIVLLRDPAERAYSHWNMQRSRGNEPLGFDEALKAESERLSARSGTMQRRHSYLSRGFYAQQLNRLFASFPREQVLVLLSDRLRGDFPAVIDEVLDFLGLEPHGRIEARNAHEGEYDAPLPAEARAWLVARYADDVRELEKLLGWDLAAWRK